MQKKTLISFLQAFGIILVVIGHSFYNHEDNVFYTWIYSFHMPLFVFISGYLFKYTLDGKGTCLSEVPLYGKNGFIIKKVKRLLIPYVVISTIAFFPKVLLSNFAARGIEFSWSAYSHMLLYPWSNVIIFFWFLPTLFIIFMIVVYSARISTYIKYAIPGLFILILLLLLHLFNPFTQVAFFNIVGVCSYLFYFVLGYYFCQMKIEQRMNGKSIVGFCCTFSLSILLIFIPSFIGRDVLLAVNGILMSAFLGLVYVKYNYTFLHFLFGASYAIYLFSWFPQVLSQQIFLGLTHAPWIIGSCLSVLSGVYIPLWIYKWIIKNKTKKKSAKVVAALTGQ